MRQDVTQFPRIADIIKMLLIDCTIGLHHRKLRSPGSHTIRSLSCPSHRTFSCTTGLIGQPASA